MFNLKKLVLFSSLFALLILVLSACKKKEFDGLYITDFSPNYTGVVEYIPQLNSDTSSVEKFANISVINTKGDTLIKVPAIINTELDIPSLDSIQSNLADSPFGFQSIIIYDDFNCDGNKDLAIKTGNMSCYGAPSYNIYLGNKKGGFELNQEFTALAQQFCGIFKYDCESKTIETYKKEGSVWNQFQTYDIVKGLPQLKKQIVFDNLYYPISIMTETLWIDQIPTTRHQVGADQIRGKELASFTFDQVKEPRKVLLYESLQQDSSTLYLFLVDVENYILQDFPKITTIDELTPSKLGQFVLTKKGTEQILTFKSDNAKDCVLSIRPNAQIITVSDKDTNFQYKANANGDVSLVDLLKNKKWSNLIVR